MDADLQPVHDRIMQATRPEEVFKPLTVVLPPRLLEKHLAPEMETMRAMLTADYSSSEDTSAAELARARLDALHQEALGKAALGMYALDGYTTSPPPSGAKKIVVAGVAYTVGALLHKGEHSSLYRGFVPSGQGQGAVVIRIAHTPSDNPYLFNEIRMLDLLHRQDVGYWRNLPFMFGRFNAGERVGVVCRYFDGLTLEALRADPLYRNGLDQRHVVWVLDRMLSLLGYMHKIGIVHGHIAPRRVRVCPSNHNVMLSGWGHAVYKPLITGEEPVPLHETFEAPEIGDKKAVGPWTDIYSLGKTLIWLLGGDPVTNEMPEYVEPKFRQFLLNMVPKNPKARPHDAWQLYDAQNRLKDSLWERRFLHLNLTT